MTRPTEGSPGHLDKHAAIDDTLATHTTQIAAGDVTNPASAAGVVLSATIAAAVAPPVTTLTVKPDGTAQFTSPKAANDSITDSGPGKPYVILVYPGTYVDAANWVPVPYVTIRGTSKDLCILRYTVAVDATDATVNNTFTIEIHGTVGLENLTIAIRNGKYAVHSEQAGTNLNARHNVRNVRAVHEGYADVNTWRSANPGSGLVPTEFNSQAAWGYGSGPGVVETLTDCIIESSYGPLYGHNNENFTAPTTNTFTRCRITTTSPTAGGITINSLGSGQADSYVFTDCQLDTLYIYDTDVSWRALYANHSDFDIVLNRCNPVGYFNDTRGFALTVANGYGATDLSTVRVSGTAVPIVFGQITYRDGGYSVGGIGFGSLDISGILIGAAGNVVANNTLGRRLGNRTGSPVTLTFLNQGFYSQSYTFNTDYTTMTNQQITDLINAAVPGFTLYTYNPALNEFYPRVLGSESSLVNGDTVGAERFVPMAYMAGGRTIRKMATNDPIGIFAGITLERSIPGKATRILREGIMHKTQLAGLSAATIAAGTVLYHSDTTAGQFATTGTRVALSGRAADWAYFKASA